MAKRQMSIVSLDPPQLTESQRSENKLAENTDDFAGVLIRPVLGTDGLFYILHYHRHPDIFYTMYQILSKSTPSSNRPALLPSCSKKSWWENY